MIFKNSLINRALLLILPVLTACGELPYSNIDNNQLQLMLDKNIPIYDVRRPEEWLQTGIVENSKLLTFVDNYGRLKPGFVEKFTSENDKDTPIIVICRTGNRTRSLSRYLADELGYTQIYNVRNGITHWISESRPVIKPLL